MPFSDNIPETFHCNIAFQWCYLIFESRTFRNQKYEKVKNRNYETLNHQDFTRHPGHVNFDARVRIGMLVGPSKWCSQCGLDLAVGFGTLIGSLAQS